MTDTADRVKAVIAKHLGIPAEEVLETASLTEDLGADSLEIVEIMMAFEEEFGLDIDDEKIDAMSTVGDAIRFLETVRV